MLRQRSAERRLQTWWIDYHVDGRRYRESSKTRRRSDALALLKLRMGEHATGQYVATEVKRLTFEDLETVIVTSYERKGHRSLGRLQAAFNHLRDHFAGWKAIAITARPLEQYATDRLKEAAPATVKYELALLLTPVPRGCQAASPPCSSPSGSTIWSRRFACCWHPEAPP